MAYILHKGEEERQFQFFIDKDSDISGLPTSTRKGSNGDGCVSIGSIAISMESGKLFVLNSSDVWTKVGKD